MLYQTKNCLINTTAVVLTGLALLSLSGCHDQARAATPRHTCAPERDMGLQSHFMIWSLCTDHTLASPPDVRQGNPLSLQPSIP